MSTDRMGFSRRGFLAAGGAVAAGATLSACGGGKSADEAAGGGAAQGSDKKFSGKYTGPAVTLSYWNGFTGGDGPFMDKLVEQFQQENPKIKVKQNTIQWADYYQRVPAAVNAGKGPDVGAMHLDQLATAAARNIIIPLDDLTETLGLTADDFTQDVWDAGIYQGKRYGIPLDVHSLANYWNKDQAAKAGVTDPPQDAQAFMGMLDKLQGAGFQNPFWMPAKWPAHLMFLSLLWQNGGQPYSDDGTKATYDSDAGVQALTWMVDMVKKGYSPKNVAQDSQYVAFKNGKDSVTWDGIWQINDLQSAKVPFGLSFLPQIGDQLASWANSHHFYISRQAAKDDNKLQASKMFIDWMSEHSGEWAGAGMVPARKSVREQAVVTSSPQAPIAENIDKLRFLPPVPGLPDLSSQTIELAVSNAVQLKASPADALSSAASKATKLMEENKKKFGG